MSKRPVKKAAPLRSAPLPVPLASMSPDTEAPVPVSAADPDPDWDPVPELDAFTQDCHQLLFDLEAAARGHGMDRDRLLHLRSAQALRTMLGLGPDDPLSYPAPAAPYGPVRNDPPIGHSLPDPDQKQR